jgi:hypothetical protein
MRCRLLTLLFTCLAFSVSVSLDLAFKHSSTAHAFFPEHLFNHPVSLSHTFPKTYTKHGAHSLFLCRIRH